HRREVPNARLPGARRAQIVRSRDMRVVPLLVSCLTLAPIALALSAHHAAAQFPPPIEMRVPKPPTVAPGDGQSYLAYELHITNFAGQAITLRRVEVLSPRENGRVLLSLEDSTLARSLSRPGSNVLVADRPRIAAGLRAILFLWIPVDRGAPPTMVRHRLTVDVTGPDSGKAQVEIGRAHV